MILIPITYSDTTGNSTYTVTFDPAMQSLQGKEDFYEIGLFSIITTNAVFNIGSDVVLNTGQIGVNNVFDYFNGTTTKQIIIPAGSYDVLSLGTVIGNIMTANGDTPITFGVTASQNIVMNMAAGYTVTLGPNSPYLLLGFNTGTYSDGATSQNIAEFFPINVLNVNIDGVVSSGFPNGARSSSIFSFAINGSPGVQIGTTNGGVNNIMWMDIVRSPVQNMTVFLSDNFGNKVNLHGASISMVIYIRKKTGYYTQ